MKYPYGPIDELTSVLLRQAILGCTTQADVLCNMGYSESGQNRKNLKVRAAELDVELPGRPRKVVEGTATPECLDTPGGQSVLPPGCCKGNASTRCGSEDPGPIVVESSLGVLCLGDSAFQTTIDELEEEISTFQVEIDKRRRAQESLRALDE